MITNADMTIYNFWYDPEKREGVYRRTQICGIHWYTEQKVNVTDKGIVSGSMYKIRIPKEAKIQYGREYLDAKLYHLLSREEVSNYWTVDNDDLFVKGLVSEDIKSLPALKSYPEAGKINSFSVNYYGLSPHIRIGGVV